MGIENNDIRKFLIEELGEDKGNDIVFLPDYANAFEGIAMFSLNAIYSYRKMILIYALKNHMAIADAVKDVQQEIDDFYKVLKSKAPIINMGNPFENDEEYPNNDDIRYFLISKFGDDKRNDITIFPGYAPAFTGMSMFTNRIIYDLRQMADLYALEHHITDDDALKKVKEKIDKVYKFTGSNAPIINMGSPFEDDK